MKYNFIFKDLLLYGQLGPIKLGSPKKEVEDVFGNIDCEQMYNGTKLASYDHLNLQFYYDANNLLINFHLSDDIIVSESTLKNRKTLGMIEILFSDFNLFYLPPIKLFSLMFEDKVKIYYLDKLSGEYCNYFYVNSNNVKMFFNPYLSSKIEGASLCYIGADYGSINQAFQNEAIEINSKNLIVPPNFNEIEIYPNGRRIR
jgi:hypothetical protein